MRLFIAIRPPEPALDEIEAATRPLRSAWPGLRWTGREDWHLTLAFLGEVADPVLPELRRRLERAAGRHARLELSVRGAGAFPSAGRAQVLWAGIGGQDETLDSLSRLADSVAAGARRAKAPPPDTRRRYRPHLTLARCKVPADARPLVAALAQFAGSRWTAADIHLISSQPGGQPRYAGQGTWPLREASAGRAARAAGSGGSGQGQDRPATSAR